MLLQAWDPYYFSPFGVETKLRSYSMVGARISSPNFSPLFPFFCFKYSFRFFFVKSCHSRSHSFHSHRVSLAGLSFCRFFAVCLFLLFIYLREISFPQFNFVAFFVESHIVLSFRNLGYVYTEWVQKPLKRLKSKCDFEFSDCGKYVDKSPCPWSLLAVFLWNCHMQVLHTSFVWACNSAQSRSQHWSGWGGGDEGEGRRVGGARNGKDRVFVFKTLWNRSLKLV